MRCHPFVLDPSLLINRSPCNIISPLQISLDALASPMEPWPIGIETESWRPSPLLEESDFTPLNPLNESSQSNNVLLTQLAVTTSMPESLLLNKPLTLNAKRKSSVLPTPIVKSSLTLDQDSTGTAKASRGFWTSSLKTESIALWLPMYLFLFNFLIFFSKKKYFLTNLY